MDWFGLVVPSMNPMHVGLIHLAGLFHAPPPSAFSTPRNHQPPSRRLKSWPNHKTLHHHLKEKKPTTTSLPAAPAMRQLPLRLLRSAAAGSLRSPTLSRGGCPVPLAPHLSAEAAATPAELARWLPRRGYSRFASGFTPLEPKKLGSILDVERAKGLSPEHLVAAWDDYHLGRGHIGVSIKAKLYRLLEQRSATCPYFVIPLWRGSGCTTMFMQG
uniref:Uncharacterized protein n=1 Tax=Triticum urartu TaxID=4572 RepID=A0A8R7UDM3_TRIUA